MDRVIALLILVFTIAGVHSEIYSDEDFQKFPKLFHLDDFEHCMERTDGVYCLGQFEIYSDAPANPLYDLMKEKSQSPNVFNRTLLHRGYCLPKRCSNTEANVTARFERCVDTWARTLALRTRLQKLHYCRAHAQPRPNEPDTNDLPHRVFLYCVYGLLAMAVFGTVYDLFLAKRGKKNPFLTAFSIRINWQHLTSNYYDTNPRLRELEVFHLIRFLLGFGLIMCHVLILTTATYQHNPRAMEKVLFSPSGFMIGSAMTTTLLFLFMSNFLASYNLLMISEKVNFTLKMYPLLVLKRVIRMYPVYLLLNGFAATWWRSFGDGPMWPVLLGAESEICRKKFWVTAVFLQNFINRKELCLVQTWIMAVDMQIHLLSLFLTLVLMKHRKHAVKILSALFVLATALLTWYTFKYDMIPTYLYMTPEVYRNIFLGADSFFDLYINPINGLMISLAGVAIAFVQKDHHERGVDISKNKFLLILHYLSLPALYLWWYLSYAYFRHFDHSTQNAMVVIERLVTTVLQSFIVYCLINIKGFYHSVFSWRGLRTITRLSFSVSMCHWCINVLMLTNRWTLHDSSPLGIILDFIGVHILSHIVALPLTLLVEYPLQKFLDRAINFSIRSKEKSQ
ncbi:nose resistant to fluoxetine protein 6-like [Ostrinia nubilalis]|uniref:nose resistant to fluoxetine protein 6-like n=1 Tax=Ostrinia nubilalis TaxID=29057 RepID=UPI00308253AD